MFISSVFARSALVVGAALALAGCNGAGLDYGTSSISTTACQGFTPTMISPTDGATNVTIATSSIEFAVTPATSGLAETPTSYEAILTDNVTGSSYTLGTLTVTTPPSGAPANTTYLTADISSPQPLAQKHEYFIAIYNPASTCELKDFANFTTGTS